MSAILQYTLAGVSLLAAMIVTILHGLASAALQSVPHAPAAGLAPVALGALTCAALIGLNVILHKDVRSGQQWPKWKQFVFYFTGAYLLIAAASITGTMARDQLRSTANQQGLFIARSVFWSFSVFTQGLYYGYLIVALVQKNQTTSTWPHPYSQDMKLETFPDSPATLTPPSRICDPEEFKFDTRRSSLRKYPRRSHRFSGGTLCLQKSLTNTTTTTSDTNTYKDNTSTNKETRPNSFETTSSISTITPQTPTEPPTPTLQQDTRPLLRTSIRSMPSLRREQHIHASLNSLVRPAPAPAPVSVSPMSPSSSTTYLHPDSPHTPNFPTGSFPGESNIHPLFRSNSPSPSPTPGLGTSVKASPSAGQTITKQTLTRMRSARSLRERERIPSPLPSPTGSSYSLALSLSPEEERGGEGFGFYGGEEWEWEWEWK
ncbi:hypothetical protein N7509_001166 [Penicillium cosmopolitanum]|uniref:Uncharacterized protein n=1 Tax=Penicillium cosmopolitanum TaxID=1131564 RepID=A0A9W9WCB8_9EURO|nr:uncharacterized protein N7509_001166 [Penicillium cosmopolitanum]KAJ5414539.1 hypothetical protein N7509_001166 [Penicillium cosmopolitanum]